MAFSFSQCRDLILQGILAGIKLRTDEIVNIAKEAQVTGISLDLVPWHSALGLSMCEYTDLGKDVRYCNVEWAHFDVVSNETRAELERAVEFIHEA